MSLRTIALAGLAFATLQTAHAATAHALKHRAVHPHAAPADPVKAPRSLAWLGVATPQVLAAVNRADLRAATALLSPADAPIPPHAR